MPDSAFRSDMVQMVGEAGPRRRSAVDCWVLTKGSMMAEQTPRTMGGFHRNCARSLFNRVWERLEKPDRTADEEDEMIHAADASRYHWGVVGTPTNRARGEWQLRGCIRCWRGRPPCTTATTPWRSARRTPSGASTSPRPTKPWPAPTRSRAILSRRRSTWPSGWRRPSASRTPRIVRSCWTISTRSPAPGRLGSLRRCARARLRCSEGCARWAPLESATHRTRQPRSRTPPGGHQYPISIVASSRT